MVCVGVLNQLITESWDLIFCAKFENLFIFDFFKQFNHIFAPELRVHRVLIVHVYFHFTIPSYLKLIIVTSNPCPSTDCWTHDVPTNTCTMKIECASLTCGATGFDVTFKSALFNLEDNQSLVTMAGGVVEPVWDGLQWTTNSPLGENGMTYAVDGDRND